MGRRRHVVIHDVIHDVYGGLNEMGRDPSAIMTWSCACARMCRAYIRQLAHYNERGYRVAMNDDNVENQGLLQTGNTSKLPLFCIRTYIHTYIQLKFANASLTEQSPAKHYNRNME